MTRAAPAALDGRLEGAVSVDKMSPEEFKRIVALVFDLSGIVVKEHKREMIFARISRRLRALNIPTVSEYLAYLEGPKRGDEIGELINAVTTNLTSFFRENHHFEHLRDEILRPMAASGARRARIWSSACSSGEEPYSIAMTALSDASLSISDLRILATDLDTNILARAQSATYKSERIDPIAPDYKNKFLTKKSADDFVFTEKVRSLITFRQLNLMGEWPMRGPFDVIFCRNVLIYFDAPTKKKIVSRMAQLLRPDGALYLGHSESLLGGHELLLSEGRTIYRRKP